ncbi:MULTISPECIES: hypothetical protein [Pseudomonas]|uniref:hypothetical protein n=1 Tax=Pseudomonas TaxID=286 RepID=UPI000997E2C0|nr:MULTISPECIES: hypothetical protein [Pseudomonas]OOW01218.1 hypothetical protein MF6394_16560 [Pseudomonas sp. MF6394]
MGSFMEYWALQKKWWSSRTCEWWASHFTAIYVGGAILIMASRFDELLKLELNEIGDLSAGIFGPVAFLWLVLGYMQQGRELKISSEALQMQAAELKESVEQQKSLVEAQHESLRNYERSLEPLLELKHSGSEQIEGDWLECFEIRNFGDYCDNVVMHLSSGGVERNPHSLEPLHKDVVRGFFLSDMVGIYQKFEMKVKYRKLSGLEGCQVFDIHVVEIGEGADIRINKRAL